MADRSRPGTGQAAAGCPKIAAKRLGFIPAAVTPEDPADLRDLPDTCLESLGFGRGSAPSASTHLGKRCPDTMVTGSAGINTEHGCGLFA